MKKYAAILLTVAMLVLSGCSGNQQNSTGSGATPDAEGSTGSSGASTKESATGEALRTATINASDGEEVGVRVEIADDSEEQAQGLMNRTSLGEDQGMLFVFDEEATLSFWMRNTLIPLSVAYIDSEGRIVDIQKMEPLDDEPPQYVSAEPAQYALEVNQGFFEERGVEVGNTTELPL